MKSILFLLSISLAVTSTSVAIAEESRDRSYRSSEVYTDYKTKKEEPLRPGMERKKIGGITAIVPEGTEVYKKNGLFHMEAPDEYAARRFKETEKRLEEIDGTFLKIQARLDDLALSIDVLEKKIARDEPGEAGPEISEDEKNQEETVDYYGDTDNVKTVY